MGLLSLKDNIGAPDDEIDSDTVNEEDLKTLFETGTLITERILSNYSYILHLDATR